MARIPKKDGNVDYAYACGCYWVSGNIVACLDHAPQVKPKMKTEEREPMITPESPAMAKAAYTMKKEIETCITTAMGQFQKETGLCPSHIRVNLMDVTHQGRDVKVFVVESVEIEVSI